MLLISRPAGVLSSSVIRQLSISSYRLHPQRELIVRKKRGRVPWSSATIYSVVMAGKLGVHCKSCGKEIEIDDDYVRGIRGVQMAANLYMHLSTKAKVAASRIRPWRKTLTCENPACRETHTYGTYDLCLYGA